MYNSMMLKFKSYTFSGISIRLTVLPWLVIRYLSREYSRVVSSMRWPARRTVRALTSSSKSAARSSSL